MRFLIIILLFSKVVSQDIGQKMIDNGDYESALNYYQYLLNEENLSKDDIISVSYTHLTLPTSG